MASPDRIVENAEQASFKLKQAVEIDGRPLDSRVIEFSKFIAGQMNHQIVPDGFVMASVMAMADLKTGVDGYTQAPLVNPLVGRPEYVYDLLFLNIPTLAKIGFSKPFADEVDKYIKGVCFKTDREEDEWILAPVVNIEQAQTDIIESAKTRVIGLDWKNFDLQDKTNEIANAYNILYPLILRNAGMNFPLNLFREDDYNEALALRVIDSSRKTKLGGGYSLALIKEKISIEEATLIRDWLTMKAPEGIAIMNDLSPELTTLHFMESNKAYLHAGLRTRQNLANRGLF